MVFREISSFIVRRPRITLILGVILMLLSFVLGRMSVSCRVVGSPSSPDSKPQPDFSSSTSSSTSSSSTQDVKSLHVEEDGLDEDPEKVLTKKAIRRAKDSNSIEQYQSDLRVLLSLLQHEEEQTTRLQGLLRRFLVAFALLPSDVTDGKEIMKAAAEVGAVEKLPCPWMQKSEEYPTLPSGMLRSTRKHRNRSKSRASPIQESDEHISSSSSSRPSSSETELSAPALISTQEMRATNASCSKSSDASLVPFLSSFPSPVVDSHFRFLVHGYGPFQALAHLGGITKHEEECENHLGFGLLRRFLDASKPVCDPRSVKESAYLQSRMMCSRIRQIRHTGDDSFCWMDNALLDFEWKWYISRTLLSFSGGDYRVYADRKQVLLNCEFNSGFSSITTPLQMSSTMSHIREAQNPLASSCTETWDSPVLLVYRENDDNYFHRMAEFINAYMAFMMVDADFSNTRVIIMDSIPDGNFYQIWNIFSTAAQVVRFSELSNKRVCAKKVLVALPGGTNFIWKDCWRPNDCQESSLLQSFSRFFLSKHHLLEENEKTASHLLTGRLRILFSKRHVKPNALISRVIVNEREILDVLKSTTDADVNEVDFGVIPFTEQLNLIRNTDIFIGMHGAGMTHAMFLPEHSVVFELFPLDFWTQSAMRNLARWTKKTYLNWRNVHEENHKKRNDLSPADPPVHTVVEMSEFRAIYDQVVQLARISRGRRGFCGIDCNKNEANNVDY